MKPKISRKYYANTSQCEIKKINYALESTQAYLKVIENIKKIKSVNYL